MTTNPARSEMFNKPLGDDLRHDLIRVVHALAALVSERIGKRRGEVVRVGGRQHIAGIGHAFTLAERRERNKNGGERKPRSREGRCGAAMRANVLIGEAPPARSEHGSAVARRQ